MARKYEIEKSLLYSGAKPPKRPENYSLSADVVNQNNNIQLAVTAIGSGDRIRVDCDLTTKPSSNENFGKSTELNKAKGAYLYLQLVTKNGKAGDGNAFTLPGTDKAALTSGIGYRNVNKTGNGGSDLHEGIDIAGIGEFNDKLPITCPFIKGKITYQSKNYGQIRVEEINPNTGKTTGRGCRWVHCEVFKKKQGDEVKFNDILSSEGRAGENGKIVYGYHSHWEMYILTSKTTTVDGKLTGISPDWKGYAYIAPTLEEIKCAHGLSETALPLPEVTTSNNVTNYKCIF